MRALILGQAKPDANISENLVQVGENREAQFNIFVCNQNNEIDDFVYVSVVPAGATLGPQHYVFFNTRLDKGATAIFNGFCLSSNDRMIIRTANGYCSFTATGLEI